MNVNPTVLEYLVEAYHTDARQAAGNARSRDAEPQTRSLRRLFHLPAAARGCRAQPSVKSLT